MTQAETLPVHHHHFQTFFVMALAGSAVVGAGYVVSGGINSVRHHVQEAKATSFGLKNIDLSRGKEGGVFTSIGTTASSCLNTSGYSVDRVYKVGDSPDTYKVTVQKVGQGALDAAAVEACVHEQTGQAVEVVVAIK